MAKLMFLIKNSPSPSEREINWNSRRKNIPEIISRPPPNAILRFSARFPSRMQRVSSARIYFIKFPVLNL